MDYKTQNSRRLTSMMMFLLASIMVSAQYRTIDGTDNHPENLGAAHAVICQKTTLSYEDGISQPAAPARVNPRIISNYVFDQNERVDNSLALSDFVWAFGQFLDHDISLVGDNHDEALPVSVIEDDEFFKTGDVIVMDRSIAAEGSGTDIDNPRSYKNEITSFIDASNVYGSDEERALWLRDSQSNIGLLKVSQGDLLPWNTDNGELNGSTTSSGIPEMDNIDVYTNRSFVAGDSRANENPLLISMHTIFVREHNRICKELAVANPGWSGDKIYLEARKWVGAYMQAITYFEWLPAQGIFLPSYNSYNESFDPSVSNVFSAAAFRMGHTLINSSLIRMENDGVEMQTGNIELRDAYFNPTLINISGGIEPYLIGMATNLQQEFDCKMVDDLRNFLFADTPNGAFGLDLAAINIQRGRERGLPDFNTVRYNFGLPRINDFLGITGDSETAEVLSQIYEGDFNDIDPWVGMLAEEHEPGALMGKTVMTILEKQFQALRDGDRFYFENDASFSSEEIESIKNTTLHDIITRNTDISLMQENVFDAMPYEEIPNGPELLALELEASLYPNPVTTQTTVKFYMETTTPMAIVLYSSTGEKIWSQDYEPTLGENFINLEFDDYFPRGIYNVKLETESAFKILRLLKY